MYIDTEKLMDVMAKLMPDVTKDEQVDFILESSALNHNRKVNRYRLKSGKWMETYPRIVNELKTALIDLANKEKVMFDMDKVFPKSNPDKKSIISYDEARAALMLKAPDRDMRKRAAKTQIAANSVEDTTLQQWAYLIHYELMGVVKELKELRSYVELCGEVITEQKK